MRYAQQTVTPPAVEPVGVAEMKLFMRVEDDFEGEDELIASLIATARAAAENYTGRAFITQTVRLSLDGIRPLGDWEPGYYQLPVDYFDAALPSSVPLPRQPIQSIVAVTTYDASNVATVYSPSLYTLIGSALTLNRGSYWPSGLRTTAPGVIDYLAGYGEAPESVPAPIRTAIKMHVAAMYEERGQCSDDVPAKCQQLLRQYKIDRL